MKIYQKYFYDDCIIAPQRHKRPFINEGDTMCPFCLANKAKLNRIIHENWQSNELMVRIVPNLYPMTSREGSEGIHDVIIDTQHHTLHPKDFSLNHWEILLSSIHQRWQNLLRDPNIRHIQVFKNYGKEAGASISHSHWQLVALEELPYSLKKKYEAFKSNRSCYLCEKIHNQEGYLIGENSFWEVWVPPVPQFPYEVWFIPKKHYQHYGQLALEEIRDLGKYIKYLLEVYHQLQPNYAFNLCMMSGDLKDEYPYHFHIKLVMRIGRIAGFEIATGCHVISIGPEVYAEQIKNSLKGIYK